LKIIFDFKLIKFKESEYYCVGLLLYGLRFQHSSPCTISSVLCAEAHTIDKRLIQAVVFFYIIVLRITEVLSDAERKKVQ